MSKIIRKDTLNRCHHIASRLEKLARGNFESSLEVLEGSRTSSALNKEQEEAQVALGEQALAKLELAEEASREAEAIRMLLVKQNAKGGVGEILAAIKDQQARLAVLKKIAATGKRVMNLPHVSDVNVTLAASSGATSYRHQDTQFRTVKLVSFQHYEGQIANVEAILGALNDQLSEANSAMVEYSIDKKIAGLIGLT